MNPLRPQLFGMPAGRFLAGGLVAPRREGGSDTTSRFQPGCKAITAVVTATFLLK